MVFLEFRRITLTLTRSKTKFYEARSTKSNLAPTLELPIR